MPLLASKHDMKHILITTIVAVLLVVGVTQGFTQSKDNNSVRSQDTVVSTSGRIHLHELRFEGSLGATVISARRLNAKQK